VKQFDEGSRRLRTLLARHEPDVLAVMKFRAFPAPR